MRFATESDSRNLPTYLTLLASLAIVAWLSIAYTGCFAVVFGPAIAWAAWCVAQNRRWRICVDSGVITWDSHFGKERSIPVSEISGIELRPDEGTIELVLRFKNGKRKRFYVPPKDRDEFIAAILQENPSVTVQEPEI